MYQRILNWLKPDGTFRCVDGHYTLPLPEAHDKVWELWTKWAKPLGASDDEIAAWKQHEEDYDNFVTIREHLNWLDKAGFEHAECYWKKDLWAIWGGQRPL